MIQQISNSHIHDSDKAAVLKCISEVSAAGAKRIKGQDAYDRAAVLFNMEKMALGKFDELITAKILKFVNKEILCTA